MTPGDRTRIESLSGGDRLGTGGPGLEAGEAGSSPSGGAPGSGPEGGHQGSCPASHPAFNPKEAEGCLPCVSMAATLSQPRSHSRALPPGTGAGVHWALPPPPGTGRPLVGTSRLAAPKPPGGLGLLPPGAGGPGREDPGWTAQPPCHFSYCQDSPRLGGLAWGLRCARGGLCLPED